MKKYLLLTFVLLFVSHFILTRSYAQEINITGSVVDADNNTPLQGANVYLSRGKLGTITDKTGYFSLAIHKQDFDDSLVINYLGYNDFRIPVKKYDNGSTIHLQASILALEKGITIFAEKFDLTRQEIPHTPYVIDFQQIDRIGTIEISDLFKTDPSIRIEGNDLDGRKIQIRGSDPDEVNVYLDGVLINDMGADNSADLSVIPVANIEKMEILKGANLVLLGNGAFGGVVNITSRKKLESEYSLNLKYGSSTSRFVAADLSLPLANQLYFNYYGNLNKINPEIELFPSERYDEKTRNNMIRTTKQNHQLSLNYYTNQGHYSTKILGYVLDYNKPDWQNQRKNIMVAGAFQGNVATIKNIDLAVDYLFNDDVIRRNAPQDARYVSTFLSQRLHLRLAKNFIAPFDEEEKLSFQVLGEYFNDQLFDKFELEQPNKTGRLYDGFLYENRGSLGGVLSFGNKMDSLGLMTWETYIGIRGDFLATGRWYKLTSFGFQVNMQLGDGRLSPFISFGENIKIPTLQESAYLNHLRNLQILQPGSEPIKLIPENSSSYETGVKYLYLPANSFFNNLDVSLALFSTKIFNKLLRTRLGDIILEGQLGEVRNKGIELVLKVNELFSNYNLGVSLGTLKIDNPLLYAYKPDRRYSLWAEYISHSGWYITGIIFWEGKSIAWNQTDQMRVETIELPSFYDIDLSLGYSYQLGKVNFRIQASGYNILDHAGYQFYELKKRFMQIGFRVRY